MSRLLTGWNYEPQMHETYAQWASRAAEGGRWRFYWSYSTFLAEAQGTDGMLNPVFFVD